MKIKPIQWTEERQPFEGVRYNHVCGTTPLGSVLITWKGWKDYPGYVIDECPGMEDCAFSGMTLEEAKQEAERAYTAFAMSAFEVDVSRETMQFEVRRVDGSDQPGGKHYGCRYFVLDMDHDAHAPAALQAYAASCKDTHPQLSADLVAEFGAEPADHTRPWLEIKLLRTDEGSENPRWSATSTRSKVMIVSQRTAEDALKAALKEAGEAVDAQQEQPAPEQYEPDCYAVYFKGSKEQPHHSFVSRFDYTEAGKRKADWQARTLPQGTQHKYEVLTLYREVKK